MSLLRFAYDLAINDLRVRYKRKLFGWFWVVLNPLALLALYGVLFGQILGLSWKHPVSGQDMGFVLPFLCGLSVYLFLSDVLSSSIQLYSNKRTYVSKTSYPLWVLWLSNMIRAGLIFSGYVVILLVMAGLYGNISIEYVWTVPLILTIAIASFATASLLISLLSPFFPDLGELNTLVQRVLFYSGAVTYPLALIPEQFQSYLWANPITNAAEPLRHVLVYGLSPDFVQLAWFASGTVLILIVAALFYARVNEAVADVI